MKRVLFVIFALVFMGSFLFAQQTAEVYQSGEGNNTAYTQQGAGANNTIFIEQVVKHGDGDNTAGVSDTDRILQWGNSNFAGLEQTAGATKVWGWTEQFNLAKIRQIGDNNRLVGATSDGQIDMTSNAIQNSGQSYNELDVNQSGGGNRIGLNQIGSTIWNKADITQQGDDFLVVYQDGFGNNSAIVHQDGYNVARVKQEARSKNHATINQFGGNNRIAGANDDGSIETFGPAEQYNQTGDDSRHNVMDILQSGGYNVAGLYQYAIGHSGADQMANYAKITQFGGDNVLGAYQNTTGGINKLFVDQKGASSATLVQIGNGNNYGNINQY